MSSSGREKKKAGKGSETKGFAGKLAKNKMEVVALLAAIGIILSILLLSGELPAGPPAGGTDGNGNAAQVPAEIAGCVADNPELSAEKCWDLHYKDMALREGDSAKCGLIKDASIRENCEQYF